MSSVLTSFLLFLHSIYIMCARTHTHPKSIILCYLINQHVFGAEYRNWISEDLSLDKAPSPSPSLRATEYPKAPHAEVDLVRLTHLHWHVKWCCHYAGLVKATILLRFHGSASLSCLCSRQSGFLALIIFLTPLHRGFIADMPNGVEHFTVTYFLHFDQLWFSVVASMCCKNKLLRWRVKAIPFRLDWY